MEHKCSGAGLQERIRGSLLGFACGDSFGLAGEFETAQTVREKYGVITEMLGGGWLEVAPGAVSDDTEMLLCLARSLAECGGVDLHDMAVRLVAWYDDDPVDIGRTCRAGIHRYIRTGELERPGSDDQAGNGAVMRILPFPLAGDTSRMLTHAHLTHHNAESDTGCRCYAELIEAALAAADKAGLRAVADRYPLFRPELFDGSCSGYVVDTLRTVLHDFFGTDSYEECLVAVVNRGGDADTTGALAGGLAGAFYGQDAIPRRWLQVLDGEVRGELLQLAGAIEALRCGSRDHR